MSLAGALLVAVCVAAINYPRNHGGVVHTPPFVGEIPTTGIYVHIDNVQTYWIENSSGQFVPAATITLGPKTSDGKLRILFKSNVGKNFKPSEYIGDSNTLIISNGSFVNGEKSVTIECSTGLPSMSAFLGYKAMDDIRWIVELREAAVETSAVTKEYHKLTHCAIEPVLMGQ